MDAPAKLRVADLRFDRSNPRLAEYGIGPKADDAEIIAVLWETMDVLELVQSISASGFFAHEPLIVLQKKGQNIVIEGNRRLAAVSCSSSQKRRANKDGMFPSCPRTSRPTFESCR